MPNPSPAETLKMIEELVTLRNVAHLDGRQMRRYMNSLDALAPALLALARRAIRVEPIIKSMLTEARCCDFEDEGTDGWIHDEDCPMVTAGLITRDGKRTEQK
jgi:hypothetical protein